MFWRNGGKEGRNRGRLTSVGRREGGRSYGMERKEGGSEWGKEEQSHEANREGRTEKGKKSLAFLCQGDECMAFWREKEGRRERKEGRRTAKRGAAKDGRIKKGEEEETRERKEGTYMLVGVHNLHHYVARAWHASPTRTARLDSWASLLLVQKAWCDPHLLASTDDIWAETTRQCRKWLSYGGWWKMNERYPRCTTNEAVPICSRKWDIFGAKTGSHPDVLFQDFKACGSACS